MQETAVPLSTIASNLVNNIDDISADSTEHRTIQYSVDDSTILLDSPELRLCQSYDVPGLLTTDFVY